MDRRKNLLLATRNPHKTEEIRRILVNHFVVSNVLDHPDLPEIEESGMTFVENARLKALGISREIAGWTLADDSGLEVDALDGAPGVWSSSYGGEEGNHAKNNDRLLRELAGFSCRTARFRCTLVLAANGEEIATFEGVSEGEIVRDAVGSAGFGYDPLFVPAGHDQTMAEMTLEVKNALSHRGRAVAAMLAELDSGALRL